MSAGLKTVVNELLGSYLEEHPRVANIVVEKSVSAARAREAVQRALAPIGLGGRYVLAPSGSHPRKNNELLIAAFATLPAAVRAHRAANLTKYSPQRIALIDRGAQWMPGIDLIDLQRDRIEARVLKRAHVI